MFFAFIAYTGILVFSIALFGAAVVYVPEMKNRPAKFSLLTAGLLGLVVFFGSFAYLMAGAP